MNTILNFGPLTPKKLLSIHVLEFVGSNLTWVKVFSLSPCGPITFLGYCSDGIILDNYTAIQLSPNMLLSPHWLDDCCEIKVKLLSCKATEN